MDKRTGVCILLGFLGLLSVILGFAAYANRVKRDDVKLSDGKCIYNGTPALGLGLTAALLLLLDQILISSLAGCICCNKKRPSDNKICVGVTCYLISWVTFVLAFLLLFSGAILSSSYSYTSTYDNIQDDGKCFVMPHGTFIWGAVLSFVTVYLGITYYLIASSATVPPQAQVYSHGIAMGQPQVNAPPVFVHEDTYRRQQYP